MGRGRWRSLRPAAGGRESGPIAPRGRRWSRGGRAPPSGRRSARAGRPGAPAGRGCRSGPAGRSRRGGRADRGSSGGRACRSNGPRPTGATRRGPPRAPGRSGAKAGRSPAGRGTWPDRLRALGLLHRPFDRVPHIGRVQAVAPALADDPVVIDQDRGRDRVHTPLLADDPRPVDDVRPGHRRALLELPDLLGRVLGDPEDDERAALVLAGDHLALVWDHLPARPAPGGPEVDQDDFAAQLAQPDHIAVRVLAGDLRALVADLLPLDRGRLAAGQGDEQADEGRSGDGTGDKAIGHEVFRVGGPGAARVAGRIPRCASGYGPRAGHGSEAQSRGSSTAVSLAALRATARGPAVVRKPKTGAARRPYPSLRFGLRPEQPALACGRSEQPTTVSLAALRATARGPAVVRKPKTGAARRPYPSLRFGLRPAGRPWFGSHPRGADGRSPRRAEGYGENSRRSSGRVRAAASLRCGVLTG